MHTFTHQFTGLALTLVLKLSLCSPKLRKARGGQLGALLGQTKSSPVQAAPSLARGHGAGKKKESYRVAESRLLSTSLSSPSTEGRRGSAGALRRRPVPRARGAPHARRPPPRAPEVCELTPPRLPAGRRPQPHEQGGWAQRAAAAEPPTRAQKSLSSPIGGTAWAPGLTQPARPHSTAPSGERERPEREGDGRAAGRRGAAARPGSCERTRKFQV